MPFILVAYIFFTKETALSLNRDGPITLLTQSFLKKMWDTKDAFDSCSLQIFTLELP